MMRRIITKSNGHPLLSRHIVVSNDTPCKACSQGKLVIRPSQLKVDADPHHFCKEFKGIFVGLFNHLVDHFGIFMVLLMQSTRWSHVCLLSTQECSFCETSA